MEPHRVRELKVVVLVKTGDMSAGDVARVQLTRGPAAHLRPMGNNQQVKVSDAIDLIHVIVPRTGFQPPLPLAAMTTSALNVKTISMPTAPAPTRRLAVSMCRTKYVVAHAGIMVYLEP